MISAISLPELQNCVAASDFKMAEGGGKDRFQEVEIAVPWGHISGKWWGSRLKQPIIAIHGWQDNAGTFDKLAPVLRDSGFAVFAIDLPGHGLSSHMPLGQFYYLLWDGVQIIRRVVKHFSWKKVTLLGHSLGGAICFLYTGIFPNEVEKLITLDAVGSTVRPTSRIIRETGDDIDSLLKIERMSDRQIGLPYNELVSIVGEAYNGTLTRESIEILAKRGFKQIGNGDEYVLTRTPVLKHSSLALLAIEHTLAFASLIKCKVLNIRADQGWEWDHYDDVLDKLEESAEKVERHTVKGNHHVHLNNPDAVSGIVVNFLKS